MFYLSVTLTVSILAPANQARLLNK